MAQHFGDQVDITWKSFLLRTEPKTSDRESFVEYTQGWRRMSEMEPRTNFVPWSTDSEPPSSSIPAQVTHKVVEASWPDAARPLHQRLLEAYFSENRTISDWSVLADVVSEVGVDRSDFLAVLDEQREVMAKTVIEEHNEAIEQGITAVPTVLINNVLPVPGAQDSASYIQWIQSVIDRQSN